LRLPAETVCELGGLPLPEPGRDPLSSPAVQLWRARVRALQPQYEIAPWDVSTLVQLLQELDGLPLAIELAAARSNFMDTATLLQRMKARLRILAHSHRGVHPRHASLRNAIDSSWELLSARERAALAQCSVFAGPFSLEAAEFVVD